MHSDNKYILLMNPKIECFHEGFGSFGSIYVSNLSAAKNIILLQKHNIKAVISAMPDPQINYNFQQIPNHLVLPIQNKPQFDISSYFSQAFFFIQANKSKSNILIHSSLATCRSFAILMSYLIRKCRHTYEYLYDMFIKKNPTVFFELSKIDVNQGFKRQLEQLTIQYGIKQPKIIYQNEDEEIITRRIQRVRLSYPALGKSTREMRISKSNNCHLVLNPQTSRSTYIKNSSQKTDLIDQSPRFHPFNQSGRSSEAFKESSMSQFLKGGMKDSQWGTSFDKSKFGNISGIQYKKGSNSPLIM